MNTKNNLVHNGGTSVVDLYGIIAGLTGMEFEHLTGSETDIVKGYYTGSDAIDLSNYANLPKGSVVYDTKTPAIHVKTAAAGTSTWVSETLS